MTDEDRQRKLDEEEDEKLVREVFSKVSMPVAGPSGSGSVADSVSAAKQEKLVTVKRKAEGDEPDLHSLLPEPTRALIASKVAAVPMVKKRKIDSKNSLGIKIKRPSAKSAAV